LEVGGRRKLNAAVTGGERGHKDKRQSRRGRV